MTHITITVEDDYGRRVNGPHGLPVAVRLYGAAGQRLPRSWGGLMTITEGASYDGWSATEDARAEARAIYQRALDRPAWAALVADPQRPGDGYRPAVTPHLDI